MSLFELKERLALLKEAQQKEQQEKREKILKERQRNEKMLSEKQEAINLQKVALAHAAALRQGRHVSHVTGSCSVEIMGCVVDMHTNIHVLHLWLLSAQRRKEEKNTGQQTAKDETVLALQRKLQEKEEEYQRLKQSVNKRAKTSEQTAAHTVGKTETKNKEEVSVAFSDRVLVSQSYCSYLLHSDFCCCCFQGKAWEESQLRLEHYIQSGFL